MRHENAATSQERILEKLKALTFSPIAFEAEWDGDSFGWRVCLAAIAADNQSHHLGSFSQLQVVVAQQLGNEIAGRYDVEFYFPSPNYPELDCPLWKDRRKAIPCRRCGIPLLKADDGPGRDICFRCHMDEEREQREAKWTPEQRAGKRCYICGSPAVGILNGGPACADCLGKYKVYKCKQCDCTIMTSKLVIDSLLCSDCEWRNAVWELTTAQRETIRIAASEGLFTGIRSAMGIMKCSLNEAQTVVQVLSEMDDELVTE